MLGKWRSLAKVRSKYRYLEKYQLRWVLVSLSMVAARNESVSYQVRETQKDIEKKNRW